MNSHWWLGWNIISCDIAISSGGKPPHLFWTSFKASRAWRVYLQDLFADKTWRWVSPNSSQRRLSSKQPLKATSWFSGMPRIFSVWEPEAPFSFIDGLWETDHCLSAQGPKPRPATFGSAGLACLAILGWAGLVKISGDGFRSTDIFSAQKFRRSSAGPWDRTIYGVKFTMRGYSWYLVCFGPCQQGRLQLQHHTTLVVLDEK